MELWKVLALRRKELGIKYETLSRLSGVPETTLKKIFTGVTINPKITTVRAIAGAMGLTLTELDEQVQQKNGLSYAETQLIERYRSLDDAGRALVDHACAYAASQATNLGMHFAGGEKENVSEQA